MVEEQIRARGIADKRVLRLMVEMPRERFIPAAEQHGAFSDRAVPLDCGQTVSQPFMVAAMTEYLQVEPEHRVLEIGTGSGYQTAILARLAREVYTVERLTSLQEQARTLLESMDIRNVAYRTGDGSIGWAEMAPFDRIMVTAGAPDVPDRWCSNSPRVAGWSFRSAAKVNKPSPSSVLQRVAFRKRPFPVPVREADWSGSLERLIGVRRSEARNERPATEVPGVLVTIRVELTDRRALR